MADALQMFLLAASPLQLGAGSAAKVVDSDVEQATEAMLFADTLAETAQSAVPFSERQKAAVLSALAEPSQTETEAAEPVSPASLQAILTDEQSSADEKDAARAWLAIIRAGQNESAGITLAAGAAKPAEQITAEAKAASSLRPTESLLAAVQAIQLAEPGEDEGGVSLRAKAEAGNSIAAHSKQTDSLIASRLAAQAVVEVATDADETDPAEANSSVVASAQARSVHVEKISAEAKPAANTVSKHVAASATESAPKALLSDSDASNEAAMASKDLSKGEGAELDGLVKQLASDQAVPTSTSKASLSNRLAAADGSAADAQSQKRIIDTDAMQQAMQQGTAEVTTQPVLTPAAQPDAVSQQQTIAGSVQARAEALSNGAQTASQSGEQKSGEQKEQSNAGVMLSAMQQAQADKVAEGSGRFDADAEQDVAADSMQRAAAHASSASSLAAPASSASSAAQSMASSVSTAQLVQTQGSTVPSASAAPSISELLRQPLNLLAADASGQLRERLVMMVRNSVHSAEIKLDPAELGSMHIRVTMQQDQASVQFLVQQAHAKEVLEQQLPRLRDMLGEQGIELTDGQVAQQQSGQQQQQQTAGRGGMPEEDEAPMQEQRLSVAKPSNRLVDYYA